MDPQFIAFMQRSDQWFILMTGLSLVGFVGVLLVWMRTSMAIAENHREVTQIIERIERTADRGETLSREILRRIQEPPEGG